MINVYEINEYLYCKRRYYYIKKLGLSPKNDHIEEGNMVHEKNFNKPINNLFFQDEELGMRGRIDYLTMKDKLILYELKKGSSKRLWENDELQLLAYWLLAKKNNVKVAQAIMKYDKGKQFRLDFKEEDESRIKVLLKEMNDLNSLPPMCDNKNKCHGCNLKSFCWL